MFGRKKRHKRIEIERMADRKRRAPERTPDEIMLTRRTFVFKGLAATSFVALSGRLWQLQIRDHEVLKEQGNTLSTRKFPLPATRGLIYDRRRHLLADNQKSWAVAIVPANLPDKKKGREERAAIFATLASTLGIGEIAVIVPEDLPGAKAPAEREEIYARLAATLGAPVEDIRDTVESTLAEAKSAKQEPPAMIKVSGELRPERAAAVRALARDLPGGCVQVVNRIAYLADVEFAGDPYQPQMIKKGITKEVALGIEANRLYLPGVQIDDQAFGRRYHVGEELGHILGYTGPISEAQYKAAVRTDERGRPVLDEDGKPIPLYQMQDHVGKTGAEAGLEEILRGRAGSYVARINGAGKVVGEVPEYRVAPADGHSAVLTIHTEFQREALGIVQAGIDGGFRHIEEFNEQARREGRRQRPLPPGAGAAVVLNPRNGEILALASLPGYDPRHFASGISQAQLDAYLETDVPEKQRRTPLMNRCLENSFPPGSTLKTFIAAAGLQDGRIAADTKIKCLGHIEVPTTWNEFDRNKYWCYTRSAEHGDQDVRHALATSCDVFFYVLSVLKQQDERDLDLRYYRPDSPDPHPFDGLGIERINHYLDAFGFGAKTGIELANEDSGIIPGPAWKEKAYPDNYWSVGDTINTSIGQGYDQVTPLQLCNAMAAVANGGTLYKPTIVHQILDPQGRVVREMTPQVLRKLPMERHHLNVVREGLRMSVFDPVGLVNPARSPQGFPLLPGIDAGVKTGTAEYGTEEEKDELGRFLRAHAWCSAFAPFNDPEVCVVAFIEGGFGSAPVAAPVASALINAYFARFRS
ncbi:MAG: penicillin-binding transpeptidase domain-containing protein [Chloroflexota bacterium]|nr:penicillin-binding transpeptidase domain-containing protein [Chloroflexota bacterium]